LTDIPTEQFKVCLARALSPVFRVAATAVSAWAAMRDAPKQAVVIQLV
jgi:hypothetical protein